MRFTYHATRQIPEGSAKRTRNDAPTAVVYAGIAQIREMSGRKYHDSVKAHTSPSLTPKAKSRRAF